MISEVDRKWSRSPLGEGHSSSCSVGREDNAGSAVTRGEMTSGRRGEQVLLPPPPLGSSARLSCPRRGGSPTSRLPAAQQPAASPPLPRRSVLCPRSLVRRRSFLLCNKSVCSRRRDGSGIRPLTEGSVFTGFSGRWSSVLIFTVSGNSEACFQTPRLVWPREQKAARKSVRYPTHGGPDLFFKEYKNGASVCMYVHFYRAL